MARFIVNPRAANGTTGARWPALAAYLKDLGVVGQTAYTTGPGAATELTREALEAGLPLVVAVGGDGTINEVVNGFFHAGARVRPEAELAILPCGTGGDLIRTLGITRNPYRAADRLVRAEGRTLDVGKATFVDALGEETVRYFLNIAEAGLGGSVVDRVNHTTKAMGGFVSFLAGTLSTLASYEPCRVTLQVDGGEPRTLRSWNVVVGNGCYFGGGMRVLPEARPDDGLFDVMLIGDMSRGSLFRNLLSVYPGTHLRQPGVEHFRARTVRVEAERPLLLDLDGEQPGTTAVTFEILPGALRVRV